MPTLSNKIQIPLLKFKFMKSERTQLIISERTRNFLISYWLDNDDVTLNDVCTDYNSSTIPYLGTSNMYKWILSNRFNDTDINKNLLNSFYLINLRVYKFVLDCILIQKTVSITYPFVNKLNLNNYIKNYG